MFNSIKRGFGFTLGRILFYIALALFFAFLTYIFKLDPSSWLIDVHAAELWGYNFEINSTEVRYAQTVNGTENNLSYRNVDNMNFGYGTTPYLSYNPYWHVYIPGLTNYHNYSVYVPFCTIGSNLNSVSSPGLKGSTTNITLGSYGVLGVDNAPYSQDGTSPYSSYNSCGIVYVNFDYTGSTVTNTTNYLTFRTNRVSSSTNTLWSNFGAKFVDNGTSNSYVKSQVDRVLAAMPGQTVYDNINSNINNVNSNINNVNSNINDLNSNIIDDSIDTTSNSNLNQFLSNSNFNENQTVQNIIQLPVSFIQSLSSMSCNPITIPLPYFKGNNSITIPCMSTSIYNKTSDGFDYLIFVLKIIINGVLIYRILLGFVSLFNSLSDPTNNNVEVVEL